MAGQAAKWREQIDASALCRGRAVGVLDIAIKDLIDHLVIPNLVEEFIRLNDPASRVAKKPDERRNTETSSDSELDSTP